MKHLDEKTSLFTTTAESIQDALHRREEREAHARKTQQKLKYLLVVPFLLVCLGGAIVFFVKKLAVELKTPEILLVILQVLALVLFLAACLCGLFIILVGPIFPRLSGSSQKYLNRGTRFSKTLDFSEIWGLKYAILSSFVLVSSFFLMEEKIAFAVALLSLIGIVFTMLNDNEESFKEAVTRYRETVSIIREYQRPVSMFASDQKKQQKETADAWALILEGADPISRKPFWDMALENVESDLVRMKMMN